MIQNYTRNHGNTKVTPPDPCTKYPSQKYVFLAVRVYYMKSRTNHSRLQVYLVVSKDASLSLSGNVSSGGRGQETPMPCLQSLKYKVI